jgi:TRAP transporter TAXI family solute receptor
MRIVSSTNVGARRIALSAAILAGMTMAALAADQATVVGAGPGAGAYQMAGAMAEAVNRFEGSDVVMTNRASQGFVANTRLVETGGTDFALTNGIFVYSAENSIAPFEEMKATNIQGVGPVSTSWFQMAVPAESDTKTYMDLEGKRVNYAQKGSNTEFMTRTIFEQLGIDESINKEYMRWDQAATALIDGNIDGFSIPNPVPSPSILQASASIPVRILSVPDEVITFFTDSNPGYYRSTVPAGSYNGMEDESFETVAYTIFVTANAGLSEDLVYRVTKATYDQASHDFLVNAFKGWAIGLKATENNAFLEQMAGFGMKLHPGAARYWKERGLIN